MTTNPKGYMRNYRMELKTMALFLATNGNMKSPISGNPLKITSNQFKYGTETVFHHIIPLNGNRPNGANARLIEIVNNIWNILPVTEEEHYNIHNRKNGQMLLNEMIRHETGIIEGI